MEPTKFIWHNGKLQDWDKTSTHALTHTLHYGAGAFEGIRMYKAGSGSAVFRLDEHVDRLLYSAGVIGMEVSYSKDQLCKAILETLQANELTNAYIRPIIYYGASQLGLTPTGVPVETAIAAWEWGRYLPHDHVDVKTSKYIRIHPKSTIADAKICGHYVNSILASLEARNNKYHEALLLDYEGNIAEGPGENIFIISGETLITPPLGTILNGITRDTIMQICKAEGIEVIEKSITLEDAYASDEAFFTGTAAEVSPIRSIDDKVLGKGEIGPITHKLKDIYHQTVTGQDARFKGFLTYI